MESIRVRLQFDKFSSPELRNCLLSVNKKEIIDIKSLKQLIQKRHQLSQNILLLIDGFVLNDSDTIDGLVRDNEIIGVEPKITKEVKVKTEEKPSVSDHYHKLGPISGESSSRKRKFTDRQSDVDVKPISTKVRIKTEPTPSKVAKRQVKQEVEAKDTKREHKTELQTEQKSSFDADPHPEDVVTSSRSVPLRQAFKNATTSIRQKPQVITAQKSSTPTDTSKPKKKRPPREATEPVDRFSPIIIINRWLSEAQKNPADESLSVQSNKKIRKQSARKTFPSASRSRNRDAKDASSLPQDLKQTTFQSSENGIKKDNCVKNTENNERKVCQKWLDIDNCPPLTSLPAVGDIIAFKMLTLSADGKSFQSSPFKVGSVINLSDQMIDILLEDVLKRSNGSGPGKSDEPAIHSLKVDWSTIFEPKLIQSATQMIPSPPETSRTEPEPMKPIEAITID